MSHNRYSQSKLIIQPDLWFRRRQRLFMYHYLYQPQFGPPNEWQDLSGTHCQYRGWLHLSNFHRGEIWTYPSGKHLMLVKMQVSGDNLMMREDWQKIMRDKVRREREYRKQIGRAAKHYGEQYTWWSPDR
jgi:hypothetical protein